MKFLLFFIFSFSLLISNFTFSQNKYWVTFTDKEGVSFDPLEYFDAKAIERRIKINYPLDHISDYPVKSEYIDTVSEYVSKISKSSRWLNSVAVWATSDQLDIISKLDFVKDIKPIYMSTYPCEKEFKKDLTEDNKELLKAQIENLDGNFFIKNNIDGKGIRIAIFDGGFPTVDENPVFNHIREKGNIVKTWDFVKNKENVYDFISHGTSVMSCVGGKIDEQNIGLATGSEYLLARTEVIAEPFSEEENWLAAAEWADKNGAHIINSSLGYTYHRYFVNEMDGETSFVVKAANMAASKGILVVNSNGNDGSNKWKYVGTPADADSVLSVGAIDPYSGYHANFSSFGPTADKRLKPNVVAFGNVIAAGKSGLKNTSGTSFSSPLIAGFAACVWQMNPELNNMEVFDKICESASLYPYFDYAHGYGVPKASWFFSDTLTELKETFEIVETNDSIFVNVSAGLENLNDDKNSYLYYHIENEGIIKKYAVIRVFSTKVLALPKNSLDEKDKLSVHFNGYTKSYF